MGQTGVSGQGNSGGTAYYRLGSMYFILRKTRV